MPESYSAPLTSPPSSPPVTRWSRPGACGCPLVAERVSELPTQALILFCELPVPFQRRLQARV
jgi:hypothetical protein